MTGPFNKVYLKKNDRQTCPDPSCERGLSSKVKLMINKWKLLIISNCIKAELSGSTISTEKSLKLKDNADCTVACLFNKTIKQTNVLRQCAFIGRICVQEKTG